MSEPRLNLRGLIYNNYKNQSALAEKLCWTRQKLSSILTGRFEPNLQDTADLAKALDVDMDTLAHFILSIKSPNGQHTCKS